MAEPATDEYYRNIKRMLERGEWTEEPFTRRVLFALLARIDFEVKRAEKAEEALAACAAGPWHYNMEEPTPIGRTLLAEWHDTATIVYGDETGWVACRFSGFRGDAPMRWAELKHDLREADRG